MYYYIWRNGDGKITAYDQTSQPKPAPAILVSEEEFKELGFYRPPPVYIPPDDPQDVPDEPPTMDELVTAVTEGVNTV